MIVCVCYNISQSQIADIFKKNPHLSTSDFCTKTKAGSDCGICLESLEETFKSLGKTTKKPNNKKKKLSGEIHER